MDSIEEEEAETSWFSFGINRMALEDTDPTVLLTRVSLILLKSLSVI